jgi:hypothetical protein
MEVPFLLTAVPVGAVILHYQHAAAKQFEHHVEPHRPKGEGMLVPMAGTDHVIE